MSFSILPYGDQALLINFEQKIDPAINATVIDLQQWIEAAKIEGIQFMIPAYCSLTIGFDQKVIDQKVLITVIRQLAFEAVNTNKTVESSKKSNRLLRIPVCYETEYGLDLLELSEEKGISIEEIIALHTGQIYQVYMLGFLPGFVFMGKIPETLQCSRKITPRLQVPASSVGIAGFQTGIYPTNSPGGWQILGQTPLKIF